MAKQQPDPGRHHLRVWLKWVIQSGLIEKLPPMYTPDPDSSRSPQPTDDYARQLLTELRDPDSSRRPLKQILAEVRRFQAWIQDRQNNSRRMILAETRPEDARLPVRGRRTPDARPPVEKPLRELPRAIPPKSDPMWDDWLDSTL
jgi:hypothetical protein